MIFTMTFPLLEVALHTYKETLKLELNQFGVPYHQDVSSPVFTKVQPMKPSNAMESAPKEVQRFAKEWLEPDLICRVRLRSRMTLCDFLLDRVLPLSAGGSLSLSYWHCSGLWSPLFRYTFLLKIPKLCEFMVIKIIMVFSGFSLGFCAIGVMAHFSSPPQSANCFWSMEEFGNCADKSFVYF